ncbi:MAG TPA: response regulator [Candidatus Binatia bacterium]|jgi:DNA-binding NtrC family response regulator
MGPSSTSSFPATDRSRKDGAVLLLDDDESFRNALAESLRDDGFAVIEYPTARDVPPLTALGEIRVVVTDYDMPGTDGLAFADKVRATYPGVPIIMVTGCCTVNLEDLAAARGVCLLRKPLEYEILHNLLHRLPS